MYYSFYLLENVFVWCGCFIGLRFKLTIFKFRYLLWKFWSRGWQCLRGNQHMAITVMNLCQVKFPKKFSIHSKIWYGTKFPKSDTVQNLGSTCSDLVSHKAWRQSLEEVTKLSIEVINIIHQLWAFRLDQRWSNRADSWQRLAHGVNTNVLEDPDYYSGSCIFSKTIIATIGPATSPKAQPARHTRIPLADVASYLC